ncbi:MAG: hypothetical protein IPL61_16195 [Myxococcales bacterium]|nr:hypothetical protein [Myxococcales bacterium]
MRVAALALVGAACGGPAATAGGPRNRGGDDVGRWVGRYACQIEQAGFRYPLYACELKSDHGRLRLVKAEGQMHLDGVVTPGVAGGFAWRGEVSCTWDPGCVGAVDAEFIPIDGGVGWEAHLPPHPIASGDTMAPMVVTIITEVTAAGQGGVRYGGYGSGGWTGGAYVGEVPVQ